MKTNQTKHDANSKKISAARRIERTCPKTKIAKQAATTPMMLINFISGR
jgi:hypothetical protein